MRFSPLVRAPSITAARTRPLPRTHGGANTSKTVRHGRAQLIRETERHREQAHCGGVLPETASSRDVRAEDGGDGQRGEYYRV